MPTPTKDLRAFVGKQVRIKRDGVTHKGVLVGEVYLHVRGRKIASNRWVLFTIDAERRCSRLTSKRTTAGP